MLKFHFEKLEHLVGSVRAGSIRRYAINHRLSQPAISKSIQNLESDLEISLLIRDRHGIKLTQAGETLFNFAEEMLSRAEEVETVIKSYAKLKIDGTLVMGTYQSISVYFLPAFLKFIRKEQRDLKINLYCATSDELLDAVKKGNVDFIISIDPTPSKSIFQVSLLSDTYSLYRQVGYGESLKKSFIFALGRAKDAQGKTLLQYLEDVHLQDRLNECGDFETARAMVENGVGYAILPDRAAAASVLSGKIEPVKAIRKLQSFGEHHLVFSCRTHRVSDSSIKWILDQLQLMLR